MPPEAWSDPARPQPLSAWLKRLEALHPTDIDLGLDRVRAVWNRMGASLEQTRIVTVAGTNGKGSTATLTAQLLQAHGHQVGLYTSPHFLHFNERIVLSGDPVSDADLVAALVRVEQARGSISLTYFEFTTLAAFELFSRAEIDFAVLEVGLGGRLDAVNLLPTDCAVVTTIGLDHTDWLGDTVEAIAREKAGIARPGKPLVIGAREARGTLLQVADDLGADPHLFEPPELAADGTWTPQHPHPLAGERLPEPVLPLPSAHLALQILHLLGQSADLATVTSVFARASMPGRLQRLSWQGLDLWLDVAHNPQAASWVAQRLHRHARQWTIILGMLGDKDAPGVVQSLALLDPRWYLIGLEAGSRALTAPSLQERAGLPNAVCCSGVVDALQKASETGRPVLICGSFYTVSAALEFLTTG
ncbi:MAG: bifunctional folylpolyglutamate synthase/dihydrofolate synthase [Natronospirillum sp.]|uniref:bifunctional folylpolyglutamate synthase/dihydrofolate synthase n=1 Tax=Natronospirillum sp. TaxID=2812955 RepID=UPI0025F271AE|nr:folylpolyglutamate synthase/dihydrofolate synthase family protein [Natronospirillum sp.]MCH8551365.1 bifunctional folylpolyglutamate synthase/dihydrofolate synthase [Natronospirillum sp.]